MGGKAINRFGVTTERKITEEFLRIGKELQGKIENDLPVSTSVVRCYRKKADHGDLDLLLKIDEGIQINWREYIQKEFNPQAINTNGGVHSFDYQGFQVDFIPVPEHKWETAKTYYSYDPLGNIMGKTFHKFGLSYGWEGLFYKFRNFHGSNSRDILLTNDARKIFEFGGYDYDRYLKGFDTLEEIFNFCIDGKYFDAEMFQMENLKSIDKKRNRKRGSYHLFLNYLKDNGIDTRFDFFKDKEAYLPLITVVFPEAKLSEKIEELKRIDRNLKIISLKFNGDLVMEWMPNLKGEELGRIIKIFKDSFESQDHFNSFMLNNNYNAIHFRFMQTFYE